MAPSTMTTACNRRINTRYNLPLLIATDDGCGINEFLNNISEEGCCISSPQKFSLGDHVLIHFEVPLSRGIAEESRSFCLDGRIQWSSPEDSLQGFRYGMSFTTSHSSFFKQERMEFQYILADLTRFY